VSPICDSQGSSHIVHSVHLFTDLRVGFSGLRLISLICAMRALDRSGLHVVRQGLGCMQSLGKDCC
jgi:hypothetical protein